ncbi:hypothetical protein [Leucobacter soli]|uniref:hypothetical protein n=1 Tax=Leucobacter soli TaxID=2812850 RepID=UPI00360D48BE
MTLPPLFAVADGMGGHSAGEIASAAAVRRLAELGGATRISDGDIEEALGDAVDDIELEAGRANWVRAPQPRVSCSATIRNSPAGASSTSGTRAFTSTSTAN